MREKFHLHKLQLEIKTCKSLSQFKFITEIFPYLSIFCILPGNVWPVKINPVFISCTCTENKLYIYREKVRENTRYIWSMRWGSYDRSSSVETKYEFFQDRDPPYQTEHLQLSSCSYYSIETSITNIQGGKQTVIKLLPSSLVRQWRKMILVKEYNENARKNSKSKLNENKQIYKTIN